MASRDEQLVSSAEATQLARAAMADTVSQTRTEIVLRLWDPGCQILRVTHDLATGAISQESAGWADVREQRITDHQLEAGELEQVKAELALIKIRLDRKDSADAALFHRELNRIRHWAEFAPRDEVASMADQTMFALQELREVLVRRLSTPD